jgi:hypothetical protein
MCREVKLNLPDEARNFLDANTEVCDEQSEIDSISGLSAEPETGACGVDSVDWPLGGESRV